MMGKAGSAAPQPTLRGARDVLGAGSGRIMLFFRINSSPSNLAVWLPPAAAVARVVDVVAVAAVVGPERVRRAACAVPAPPLALRVAPGVAEVDAELVCRALRGPRACA